MNQMVASSEIKRRSIVGKKEWIWSVVGFVLLGLKDLHALADVLEILLGGLWLRRRMLLLGDPERL